MSDRTPDVFEILYRVWDHSKRVAELDGLEGDDQVAFAKSRTREFLDRIYEKIDAERA